MSTVPPIRREILVDADPAVAFEVFTAGIGQWWPLEEHGVHGKGGAVAFEDGRLVERSADEEAAVWGTVTRWEPPTAVAFTWHPGRPAERASYVAVTFGAEGGQTLVRLEHTGWEAFDDPARRPGRIRPRLAAGARPLPGARQRRKRGRRHVGSTAASSRASRPC